jgi:ubiquinone/menaquinone biosynthesis C-methylase UbiE
MTKEIQDDLGFFESTRKYFLSTLKDPSTVKSSVDLVAPIQVERALDIGSGVGHALFPLAVSKGAFGAAVDTSEAGLRIGLDFYKTHLPDARVAFIRARAESLPFATNSFDVINCSLALPYMDNARVFGEVARVLRPGGLFFLRIHHARYYFRQMQEGVKTRDVYPMLHGSRVLVAGMIYHLTGRQPRMWPMNESYQTRWLLRRELAKHRLVIDREHTVTNPRTPAFVIHKKPEN